MTLTEFHALNPKEKEIATVNGEFLGERREAGQVIALYAVGLFWVELHYDSALNEVLFLHGFDSIEKLGPYLAQLNFQI